VVSFVNPTSNDLAQARDQWRVLVNKVMNVMIVISQKMIIIIFTAVETSNLTR
jgi:hypothetical protein